MWPHSCSLAPPILSLSLSLYNLSLSLSHSAAVTRRSRQARGTGAPVHVRTVMHSIIVSLAATTHSTLLTVIFLMPLPRSVPHLYCHTLSPHPLLSALYMLTRFLLLLLLFFRVYAPMRVHVLQLCISLLCAIHFDVLHSCPLLIML